jgi:superfamily I DNA/RNA helicase
MPAWTSRPTRKLSWGWPRRRSAGAPRAPHGGTPLTLAAAPRLQRVASRDGSYLADHVLIDEGQYVDLEEEAESAARYRSARSGPVPRLIPCATLSEELDKAADLIRQWVTQTGAPETTAVLVREQRQRDRLVTGLAERGVTIRAVDREHVKPGQPVAMTMHRAKGTEFSRVLLFGIDQGAIPRPLRDEQYAEDAWADALLRERSLLYVAATRARDELAVSWSGDPSQLLPEAAR